MTNPFTDRYKTYTAVQLLDILDSKHDYQPLAVETAQTEFDSRQLTAEQLAEARQTLESLRQEKIKQQQKSKAVENKIKAVGSSILDNLNPIRTTIPTVDKVLKIICVVFTGQFLLLLYGQFDIIQFMFTDSESGWDFSMILYFLPLVLLPTAVFFFWKRKKLGWTLLAIHLTYSAFTVLYSFIVNIGRQPSGVPILDDLFPTPSPTSYILQIIFFGGTLIYICRQQIREIYTVDRQHFLLTIGSIGALTTFQWWELLTH